MEILAADEYLVPVPFSKTPSSQCYQRFNKMEILFMNEDELYNLYLSVARNVLEMYTVSQGDGSTTKNQLDPLRVCEAMYDMFPVLPTILVKEYYQ